MEKLKAETQIQQFPNYVIWLLCFLTSGMEKKWPSHLAFQKSTARLQNSQFVTPTTDDLSAPRLRHSQIAG